MGLEAMELANKTRKCVFCGASIVATDLHFGHRLRCPFCGEIQPPPYGQENEAELHQGEPDAKLAIAEFHSHKRSEPVLPVDPSVVVAGELLRVPPELIIEALSKRDRENYFKFSIPKRSGGTRWILAPRRSLKDLQRSVAATLGEFHVHRPTAHGFVTGRSIVSNAAPHVDRRWVFNLDLQDFFPSISQRRVVGVIRSALTKARLDASAAPVIARLCCYEGYLPIGAPSSPLISNMVAKHLDNALEDLAAKYGCEYTRYADDITFSSNGPVFPSAIAVEVENSWAVGEELESAVATNGFRINTNKVRMQSRSVRQSVTGIVVNERLNVERAYIRSVRGGLHAWHTYGYELANSRFKQRYAKSDSATLLSSLDAKIAYIAMVRGGWKEPLVYDLWRQLLSLRHTGDRFLFRPSTPSEDAEWIVPARWSPRQLEESSRGVYRWPTRFGDLPDADEEWLEQVLARAELLHDDLRFTNDFPISVTIDNLDIELRSEKNVVRVLAANWRSRVRCVASFSPTNWDVFMRDHPAARFTTGVGIAFFLDVSLGLHRDERSKEQDRYEIHPYRSRYGFASGDTSLSLWLRPGTNSDIRAQHQTPRLHRVRGHIRTLPGHMTPKPEAIERAPSFLRRLMGPSDTYVIPHQRGQDQMRRQLVIHLRYTTTLSTALDLLN